MGTGTEQLHTQIGRLIQAVEKQIDALVYGLYNLTEDEIEMVEALAKVRGMGYAGAT
jgi:hypothetical protein